MPAENNIGLSIRRKSSESGKTRKKLSKSSEHEFVTPILRIVYGNDFVATKTESFKNKFNVSLQKKQLCTFEYLKETFPINELKRITTFYEVRWLCGFIPV